MGFAALNLFRRAAPTPHLRDAELLLHIERSAWRLP